MKRMLRRVLLVVFWLGLMGHPNTLYAQAPEEAPTKEIIALLKEQSTKLSTELRRVQREIAALRADLDKPDLKDVFSGIGYIFGLFGVAAFVAARRKE